MAASEWTRWVRAVTDTPVAHISAPGVDDTHCVAYHPPTTISPFFLPLPVPYYKPTLWSCGKLWAYVRMGSLSTRMHWDCNAMGDAAKMYPRVRSTLSSRGLGSRWVDIILTGYEDPRGCVDPWNLRTSEWDQKLRKRECVLSLYDNIRWKWYAFYLPRVPQI